jgi:hypothetical protein
VLFQWCCLKSLGCIEHARTFDEESSSYDFKNMCPAFGIVHGVLPAEAVPCVRVLRLTVTAAASSLKPGMCGSKILKSLIWKLTMCHLRAADCFPAVPWSVLPHIPSLLQPLLPKPQWLQDPTACPLSHVCYDWEVFPCHSSGLDHAQHSHCWNGAQAIAQAQGACALC